MADAAPSRPRPPAILLRDVRKSYAMGTHIVHALRGVTVGIARGESVAIMGPSGSGKSTMMNVIGCLDVPDGGRYLLDGHDVGRLDDDDLAVVRNRKIGFVFQSFNLIPRTSALHNVELPLVYAGVKPKDRRLRAQAALERVGLGRWASHMPNELSGGQQQRVAIARATVTNPSVLLADEPTGALDSRSSADVMAIFDELNAEGRTVVLITHEEEVAVHAKRRIRLRDGKVVEDVRTVPAVRVVA